MGLPVRGPIAASLYWAAACGVVGAIVFSSIPLLFGSPHPMVRITWRDMNPGERSALERGFRLTDPVLLEDGDWGYSPTDTSPVMLRAIVTHPSVAAADGIDSRALKMVPSPPLSPRRGGLLGGAPAWMARAAKLFAYSLTAIAMFMLFRAAASPFLPPHSWLRTPFSGLLSHPVGTLTALPSQARTWMERGVPAASAEAAGLFRIAFGTAVLAFVATEPVSLELLRSYEATAAQGVDGALARYLSAHPASAQELGRWLHVSGALFIAGLYTRLSFACFVGGFLLWASLFTLTTSTHAVAALGITLICLLPARWGDAWSVDAWLDRVRTRPRRPATDGRYGYAIWIPRLVLGVAFLAAAWSKIGGGPGWIVNGTVKYHFITDLGHALVDWGPRLTQSHWVAVAMSGSAVAVEAVVITAAFSRSTALVLLCGAASLLLLAGFALFQGVIWPAWWILLIAFLPWQYFHNTPRPAFELPSLSRAHVAVVLVLVAQQFVASAFHIEARPLVSAYDMYSATYASAEDYENASNLVYRVVVYDNGRLRDLPDCLVDDRTAALLPAAAAGASEERDQLRSLLGPCVEAESSVTAFVLEGDRRVYDWQERRFESRRALEVIGPFPTDWLRQ